MAARFATRSSASSRVSAKITWIPYFRVMASRKSITPFLRYSLKRPLPWAWSIRPSIIINRLGNGRSRSSSRRNRARLSDEVEVDAYSSAWGFSNGIVTGGKCLSNGPGDSNETAKVVGAVLIAVDEHLNRGHRDFRLTLPREDDEGLGTS